MHADTPSASWQQRDRKSVVYLGRCCVVDAEGLDIGARQFPGYACVLVLGKADTLREVLEQKAVVMVVVARR